MLQNVQLLTARRAYEFAPDAIRLSLLCSGVPQQLIQQRFGFQVTQIGTPAGTFGPVSQTLPPGLVFDWGAIEDPPEFLTPVRFIHVEQRRIVIDIAGPTRVIDTVYQQLKNTLVGIKTADGIPLIGEPSHIREFSQVTAAFGSDPANLLPTGIREIFRRELGIADGSTKQILLPSITVMAAPAGKEVEEADTNVHFGFSLALRLGATPDSRLFFSSAPLTTDAHIDYLTRIEEALASETG